jgi:hypothetical protein
VLGKTEYKSLTSLIKSNKDELGLEVGALSPHKELRACV